MPTLTLNSRRFETQANETVLDTLLRHGVEIPNACRSGVCRSCLMIAQPGTVPEAAQASLREVERRAGQFLACMCRPTQDLELREIGDAGSVAARVVEVVRASESVVRVFLQCEDAFDYEPGQYVTLRRSDGLTRSFSLASLTSEAHLELHIRRVSDGAFSSWAYDTLAPGEPFVLRGPYGNCCYGGDQPDAPLLLVAVGTGLAPLWGVARHALAAGHRAPITLIQAAAEPRGLYMRNDLSALAAAHPQLRVRTCVLRDGGGDIEQVAVDELAVAVLRESDRPAEHLAFVCGDPAVVHRVRRGLFMAGLSPRRILADAFLPAHPSSG